MSKIHKHKTSEPIDKKKSSPPPTGSTNASQEEINKVKDAARKTRDGIYAYTKNIANTKDNNQDSLLDIDDDGKVTEGDGKFIKAYMGGKRGADLRDSISSPYANSNLDSIKTMEGKVQALIDNKTLDLNADGKVNNTDSLLVDENFARFEQEDSTNRLQGLINGGAANIDGNAVTDNVDIALIKAYFIDNKRGDELKAVLGNNSNTTAQQLEEKLRALGGNEDFDSNTDGKINLSDANRLHTTLSGVNHGVAVQARKDSIETLLDTGALDVNGDGKMDNLDVNLIKTIKKGSTLKGLKAKAGANSPLTGEQIQGRLKALFDNQSLDINKNGNVGGSLDLKRIEKAVNERMMKERGQSALGEPPVAPSSTAEG